MSRIQNTLESESGGRTNCRNLTRGAWWGGKKKNTLKSVSINLLVDDDKGIK